MSKELEVAKLYVQLAAELASQTRFTAACERLSQIATEVIGCPWAAVTRFGHDGTLVFPRTKDPVVAKLLEIAGAFPEGVTMTTAFAHRPTVSADLTADERWPDYRARIVSETPVRSAASHVLKCGELEVGILSLYSDRAGFFNDEVCAAAELLADQAALALGRVQAAELARNLEIAVSSNREIGVATGILMASHRVTAEAAFGLMRDHSQATHVKLRDVASEVALTGALPIRDAALVRRRPQDS